MNFTSIGKTVVIVEPEGDYPALITRVYAPTVVNLVTFQEGEPPEFPKGVSLHPDRESALQAMNKDGRLHAYWPVK